MKSKSIWILLILFSIIFFFYNLIHAKLAEIYGNLGDFYFKKGNIIEAQKYFEKGLDLGLKDFSKRDLYINSLINSPLTIDTQEKIVKFINISTEDSAKLKAKSFVNDIRREIHRKYPENYIENSVYNQKIIRWNNFPIKYAFTNPSVAPKYFVKEIENAFSEWEKATNNSILFMEDDKNPEILINFNSEDVVNNDNQKYVVAYTIPKLNVNSLNQMEINFYLKYPDGKFFSMNQVYNTALHEIAHALGFMGHSDDSEHLMYISNDLYEKNNKRKKLSVADVNTILLLYKIKPEITNVYGQASMYIPFFVLGTEKEINEEKFKEAKDYIREAPNLASGYIDLAETFVNERDYVGAIKALEKALERADNEEIEAIVYYNLAITNLHMDYFQKAHYCIQQSMKIKDSDEKHFLLAEIYTRENKTTEAILEYEKLIKKNPKNIEYAIALTNIYVVNRELLKARKTLKNYIKNNPEDRNNTRFKPYGILRIFL